MRARAAGLSARTVSERVGKTLRREPALLLAMLFGSRARGTARESSDVDIALLAEGEPPAALPAALSAALGAEVDVIWIVPDLSLPLRERILAEGQVIYQREPGRAAAWRTAALIDLETDRPWFARMRDRWLERVAVRGL
jgi:predicted nucleotidyltransferase